MSRLLTEEELEAWENHFARNASEQPEEALMVSRLIAEIRRLGARHNARTEKMPNNETSKAFQRGFRAAARAAVQHMEEFEMAARSIATRPPPTPTPEERATAIMEARNISEHTTDDIVTAIYDAVDAATESAEQRNGEPSSALSVEQMVRNILEANGVEDAQALSSGDIVGPANLLASYLTEAATQSMAKSMTPAPDKQKKPETPKVPGPARS